MPQSSMRNLKSSLLLFLLSACASTTVVDPSPEAAESGDLTLITSCEVMPSRGVEICRVYEGEKIESIWKMFLPAGNGVIGGQVSVFFRDKVMAFPVSSQILEIPLKDIVGHDKWNSDDSNVAVALAEIRWKDSQGIVQSFRSEGMAIISVLSRGYAPMPMDSGLSNWGTNCSIQYSTAGRSALRCK